MSHQHRRPSNSPHSPVVPVAHMGPAKLCFPHGTMQADSSVFLLFVCVIFAFNVLVSSPMSKWIVPPKCLVSFRFPFKTNPARGPLKEKAHPCPVPPVATMVGKVLYLYVTMAGFPWLPAQKTPAHRGAVEQAAASPLKGAGNVLRGYHLGTLENKGCLGHI